MDTTPNTTIDNHSQSNNNTNSQTYHWAKLITVWILIGIAFVGNTVIILVKVWKQIRVIKHFKNFSDLLTCFLACLDLVKSVTFLLIEAPPNIEWRDRKYLCKAVQKSLMIAFSMSSYVTLWLTCLRYYAICHPLKESLSKRKNTAISVFILVLHVMFCHPAILNFSVHSRSVADHDCSAAVRSIRSEEVLFGIEIIAFTLSVVFSAFAMSLTFRRIRAHLSSSSSRDISATSSQQRTKRNRNASRMLLIMYIAYMTSYVPWVTLYLVGSLDRATYMRIIDNGWSYILYFSVAGSFCNSFLTYLIGSKDFRKDMLTFFKSLLPNTSSKNSLAGVAATIIKTTTAERGNGNIELR